MLEQFFSNFILYFNQLSPYLLIGLFFSGILRIFLKDSWIKSQLKEKSLLSILKATLIGLPLPLCSCSVIPMTLTLRKMGASRASSASFLISTPETGVDSIFMTLSFFAWPYAVARFVTAFISAFLAGLLQYFFNEEEDSKEAVEVKSCCSKIKDGKTYDFKSGMKYGFVDIVDDIAINLGIGIILGAIISSFIPQDFKILTDPHISKLLIAFIAIPFYICASASTPIAAALVGQGLSLGGALLFLSLGPATNITNLLVVKKEFGLKGIALNILAVFLVALGMAYLSDYIFTDNIIKEASHIHEHLSWINYLSSVILALLLMRAYSVKIIKKLRLKGK